MPRKPKKSFLARLAKGLIYFVSFLAVLLLIAYGVALYNKDKILETINDSLKTAVNGDVEIGGLNFTAFEKFPTFSIGLSDVYIRGPRYDQYKEDFFNASKIYIDIEPGQLIMGTISLASIRIQNANIFVFRTADGYSNSDVFKKSDETKKDTTKAQGFSPTLDLKKISFENSHILYFDSVKRKSYGVDLLKTDIVLNGTDSSKQISINGNINFGGMMLNEQKGSYLLNKNTQSNLNIELIKGKKGMVVNPSTIQFQKSKVELSGVFNFEAPGTFTLNIHSPNLDFAEGTTIVTKALEEKLGKYQLDSPIDLKVTLIGVLSGGEPKIDIGFETTHNHFVTKSIEIKDFSFKGTFINHYDSAVENGDPNSELAFSEFSGIISGAPTTGRATIRDLKSPNLDVESHAKLFLPTLNDLSDSTRMQFQSGTFTADIKYSGKLIEYLSHTTSTFTGNLEGSVKIEDGAWEMPGKQKKFDHTEVALNFTSEHMVIEKINFNINGNPVEINGEAKGFIPFFFEPEKKGYVSLSVYSKKMDLSSMVKKKPKDKTKKKGGGNKKISDMIDVLYNKVEFDLAIKADELIKDDFYGSGLQGKVRLTRGDLKAGPIKMNTCGGSVSLTFQMKDLDKPVNEVIVDAEVKNADVKKFFKAFDNFSQKTMTSDNVNGKISTKLHLKGEVDDRFKLLMANLEGNVDFKVKDCQLKNFEPLQKMSNFLFKGRDFNDVRFAEIGSQLTIDSTSINIKRMEVQSTVFHLFIEGTYSLADDTDLSIQVPLKNLKKHEADYKPENVGIDAKVGASIFLRARNDDKGKVSLAYDPFKKMRKK